MISLKLFFLGFLFVMLIPFHIVENAYAGCLPTHTPCQNNGGPSICGQCCSSANDIQGSCTNNGSDLCAPTWCYGNCNIACDGPR